jgi:hypothetical protein
MGGCHPLPVAGGTATPPTRRLAHPTPTSFRWDKNHAV